MEKNSTRPKKVYDKYGKTGVNIYNLCDGKRNAGKIMTEAKVKQGLLVEILDFMDEHGFIRLDYTKKN